VAWVGNFPSSVVPSQMLDPHSSSHGQLVSLRNQMDLAISSSKVFSRQQVELPSSIVHYQPSALNQNWNFSAPTCQLIEEGRSLPPNIPTKSSYLYYFINASADCPPYLLAKNPPISHPIVHSPSLHPTIYSFPPHQDRPTLPHSDFLTHTTLLTQLSKPNLFKNFLNSWAQNQDNPSLLQPPPSFYLSPPITQAQPISAIPKNSIPAQPYYPKSKHKMSTHTHSRFKPYPTTRPPLSLALPTQHVTTSPIQPSILSFQPIFSSPILSLVHSDGLPPLHNSPLQQPITHRPYSHSNQNFPNEIRGVLIFPFLNTISHLYQQSSST
jgi:hypothetical protein